MKMYACVTGADRGLGYELVKCLLEKFQDEAPLTPDIPAKELMKIISDPDKYKGERPAYIDYEGSK